MAVWISRGLLKAGIQESCDLGEMDAGGWPTGHRIGFEKESSL